MGAPAIAGLTDLVEIGRGGFGTVYRARQAAFDRTVAVKVLEQTADLRTLQRFDRERAALGRLSGHPHIVSVYDGGIIDGQAYLVMEFMSRGSLGDRLQQRGPLGVPDVLRFGVQTASALASAHAFGVVHRDVKPENVLLDGFDNAQLADFGIARLGDRTATVTSAVTATIEHAAPELLDGQPPTPASDVYALGSTLHALLTGLAPFRRTGEDSMIAMIGRIAREEPPDLAVWGVPSSVAAPIRQMLAKDPAARPADAVAVGRALQHAQGQLGLPVTDLHLSTSDGDTASGTVDVPLAGWPLAAVATAPVPAVVPAVAPAPPGPPPGRRGVLVALLVLVAVALGAAVALFMASQRGEPGPGEVVVVASTTATPTAPDAATPTASATAGAATTSAPPPPRRRPPRRATTAPLDPRCRHRPRHRPRPPPPVPPPGPLFAGAARPRVPHRPASTPPARRSPTNRPTSSTATRRRPGAWPAPAWARP